MSDSILDSNISQGESALTTNSLNYLTETAKWAKFLSILGFIGLGLMIIGALFGLLMGNSLGGAMSAMGGNGPSLQIMSLLYLVIAALYFFPIYYLYNFAVKMKESLTNSDSMTMESAFENLKSHYKFMGIFAIVILSLYVLMFIFGLAASLMM